MGFKARVAVALLLNNVTIISCWLWWEVHKFTMRWERHREPFPLPFWIAELPAYWCIDLAITLIILCTSILAYLYITSSSREAEEGVQTLASLSFLCVYTTITMGVLVE